MHDDDDGGGGDVNEDENARTWGELMIVMNTCAQQTHII